MKQEEARPDIDLIIEEIDAMNNIERVKRDDPAFVIICDYLFGELSLDDDRRIEERLMSDYEFYSRAYPLLIMETVRRPWTAGADSETQVSWFELCYKVGIRVDVDALTREERRFANIARSERRRKAILRVLRSHDSPHYPER